MDKNIDLWIKNTFAEDDFGTLISHTKLKMTTT
jgi:aspartokinase